MKRGINRARKHVTDPEAIALQSRARVANTRLRQHQMKTPCVFISHKREDLAASLRIADYLEKAGVDVYLDVYDKTLEKFAEEEDADKVTKRLQAGIERSSHMICVVSLKTVESYWVPFEVGYGYDRVTLGVLTLKDMSEERLPEYMKTTDVILRGAKSLNEFIADLLGEGTGDLEQKEVIINHDDRKFPLKDVLELSR